MLNSSLYAFLLNSPSFWAVLFAFESYHLGLGNLHAQFFIYVQNSRDISIISRLSKLKKILAWTFPSPFFKQHNRAKIRSNSLELMEISCSPFLTKGLYAACTFLEVGLRSARTQALAGRCLHSSIATMIHCFPRTGFLHSSEHLDTYVLHVHEIVTGSAIQTILCTIEVDSIFFATVTIRIPFSNRKSSRLHPLFKWYSVRYRLFKSSRYC